MNAYEEEQWVARIDSLEALSQIEKEKSKKALIEIKKILGNSITSLAGQKHPITRYVFGPNNAPWTWKWLIDLVEAVQLVSNQINGLKIVNKLKNESTFDEALFHIYIAKCITDGEFNIEFLKEDNKNKIADWKITDFATKDELLVELTELMFESEKGKDIWFTVRQIDERIRKNCKPARLFYRGRLLQNIPKPTLQDLLNKIDSTAKEARKNGFAELVQNNTISLGIATNDKKPQLKLWAIQKYVLDRIEADLECSDSSFRGPAYPIDEVKRIISKIKKKKDEFNRETLNAIVIRADRLFLPAYIEECINKLEKFLYRHNYLGILIVVGGHLGGKEINDRKEKNGHLYLIRSIDLITKEILILTNKYSVNDIKTLNFSSKIKAGFEGCKTLLF